MLYTSCKKWGTCGKGAVRFSWSRRQKKSISRPDDHEVAMHHVATWTMRGHSFHFSELELFFHSRGSGGWRHSCR